ncbi:MAG TPA: hypothetical protein VFE12_15110, partial [Acetobacteraceae bacterium]|nr:hypothetical protein [Acetobacteraceae bacterium]
MWQGNIHDGSAVQAHGIAGRSVTAQQKTAALIFPHAGPPPPAGLTEIADGVQWLRLPLPYRLDHVNIYLIR